MVFVWSCLTDGDAAYTLVQVIINDLIMLLLFAPIIGFLVSGASSLTVPYSVLVYFVLAFIMIPLATGPPGSGVADHPTVAKLGSNRNFCFALLLTPLFISAFQAERGARTRQGLIPIARPVSSILLELPRATVPL
jgi:hypothetical protein